MLDKTQQTSSWMCSWTPEKAREISKGPKERWNWNYKVSAEAAAAVAGMGVSVPTEETGALGIWWPQGDSRVSRELELGALPIATTLKGDVLREGKN